MSYSCFSASLPPSQVKLWLCTRKQMSIPVSRYFSGEFLPQRQLTHVSCPFAFHLVLGKTGLIEIGTDPDTAVGTPQ